MCTRRWSPETETRPRQLVTQVETRRDETFIRKSRDRDIQRYRSRRLKHDETLLQTWRYETKPRLIIPLCTLSIQHKHMQTTKNQVTQYRPTISKLYCAKLQTAVANTVKYCRMQLKISEKSTNWNIKQTGKIRTVETMCVTKNMNCALVHEKLKSRDRDETRPRHWKSRLETVSRPRHLSWDHILGFDTNTSTDSSRYIKSFKNVIMLFYYYWKKIERHSWNLSINRLKG